MPPYCGVCAAGVGVGAAGVGAAGVGVGAAGVGAAGVGAAGVGVAGVGVGSSLAQLLKTRPIARITINEIKSNFFIFPPHNCWVCA
jgi:hypothetical protein